MGIVVFEVKLATSFYLARLIQITIEGPELASVDFNIFLKRKIVEYSCNGQQTYLSTCMPIIDVRGGGGIPVFPPSVYNPALSIPPIVIKL